MVRKIGKFLLNAHGGGGGEGPAPSICLILEQKQ